MEETQDVEFKLPETEVEKPAPKKYIIIFGSLVLIFLLIGVAYSYFTNVSTVYTESNAITADGTLFLTLVPKEGDAKGRPDAYFLDIAKHVLTHFFDPDLTSMTIAPRSAGKDALVFTTLKRMSENSNDLSSLITYYDKATGAITYFTKGSEEHLKQFPSWSEQIKGALYMTPATQVNSPDDATIYITSTEGTFSIRNGMYPQFLRDGVQYLALHNDGIYLHSLSDAGVNTKVIASPDDTVSASESFDISGDGNTLAWVEHTNNSVYLYNIESMTKETSNIPPYEKFSADIILPTLSQTGNQVIGIDTNGEPTLKLFDIESKQYKALYDLNAYDSTRTIISDWIIE